MPCCYYKILKWTFWIKLSDEIGSSLFSCCSDAPVYTVPELSTRFPIACVTDNQTYVKSFVSLVVLFLKKGANYYYKNCSFFYARADQYSAVISKLFCAHWESTKKDCRCLKCPCQCFWSECLRLHSLIQDSLASYECLCRTFAQGILIFCCTRIGFISNTP